MAFAEQPAVTTNLMHILVFPRDYWCTTLEWIIIKGGMNACIPSFPIIPPNEIREVGRKRGKAVTTTRQRMRVSMITGGEDIMLSELGTPSMEAATSCNPSLVVATFLSFGSPGTQKKMYPYVTGTPVLGIKYEDGVLLVVDMGGTYGSTLRYKSLERLKPIGKHTLLGVGGEISDFQEIVHSLVELILYDNMWDEGNYLGPKEAHNHLNRLMYNRKNKFNPLWNTIVLGGVKNGQKYLSTYLCHHYEKM